MRRPVLVIVECGGLAPPSRSGLFGRMKNHCPTWSSFNLTSNMHAGIAIGAHPEAVGLGAVPVPLHRLLLRGLQRVREPLDRARPAGRPVDLLPRPGRLPVVTPKGGLAGGLGHAGPVDLLPSPGWLPVVTCWQQQTASAGPVDLLPGPGGSGRGIGRCRVRGLWTSSRVLVGCLL